MHRRLSIAAILAGVIAQLAGLAVDSVLHARDASLAEREGVLSLSNPGHLLFAAGLGLTVLGVSALLLGPLFGAPRPRGLAGVALAVLPPVAVLALAASSFAVAVRNGGLTGHPQPEAASAGHAHTETAAQQGAGVGAGTAHGDASAQAVGADPSRHQHGTEINVSWEQLRGIDEMLSTVKAATEKYRDVNVARADGYLQVTHVVPGLGAHFVNPALMAAGSLDVVRPAILLYDQTPDGGFELVGVSWSLPKRAGNETPPPAHFGPLATWHYHTDLCFGLRAGSPVVGVNTAAGCRSAGGLFVKETGWMVHAWIFRPSPEGVFSHQNSTIKGVKPVATAR